jgi:hypothetical protein
LARYLTPQLIYTIAPTGGQRFSTLLVWQLIVHGCVRDGSCLVIM